MTEAELKKTNLEILEMARHLGVALAESETLAAYRAAEERMASDLEACQLTGAFKKAHQAWRQELLDPDADPNRLSHLEASARQADQTMKVHPLIAEYYRAGQAFNGLISQINQILKFCSLYDDTLPDDMSATSGCASCSGCK